MEFHNGFTMPPFVTTKNSTKNIYLTEKNESNNISIWGCLLEISSCDRSSTHYGNL